MTALPAYDIVGHMRTTLNLDATVMAQVKREAARRGCTMSELVESALRLHLQQRKSQPELPPLPTWKGGGELADIANRNALYDVMEGK